MPKGITAPAKIESIRVLMDYNLEEHRQAAIDTARLEAILNRQKLKQLEN